MKSEHLLAELPGTNDAERLLVVLVHTEDGSSKVSLRQQTWAERIGWFDQHSLELAPEQVHQLRALFGSVSHTRGQRPPADPSAILPFPGSLRVESA